MAVQDNSVLSSIRGVPGSLPKANILATPTQNNSVKVNILRVDNLNNNFVKQSIAAVFENFVKANVLAVFNNSVLSNIFYMYLMDNSVKANILVRGTQGTGGGGGGAGGGALGLLLSITGGGGGGIPRNVPSNKVKANISVPGVTKDNIVKSNIISPNKLNIITESMMSVPSGSLRDSATYDSINKWVQLTTTTASQFGELEYNASVFPKNFETDFDFWSGGGSSNGGRSVYFYYGAVETPVSENAAIDGYLFAYTEDPDIAQPLGAQFDGVYVANTTGIASFGDSQWHHAKIVQYNTSIKMYLDGVLLLETTDVPRIPLGVLYGLGARNTSNYNEHRVKNFIINEIGSNNYAKASVFVTSQKDVFAKADIKSLTRQDNSVLAQPRGGPGSFAKARLGGRSNNYVRGNIYSRQIYVRYGSPITSRKNPYHDLF